MELALEDDRLNLGQFMQTYVLNPGCPLTPVQGQGHSLPPADLGLEVKTERPENINNSSCSTVGAEITDSDCKLGITEGVDMIVDQKPHFFELAENTPKAYIGSNLRYAREIKDPASLPRHIRERKWLLKNFVHQPGMEGYHRVNAERVKEVLNRRFPDHATHLVTRIMKLAFPACKKIILKNGHFFLGLQEKDSNETWNQEKRKRGRKRGRKPRHVIRRVMVAGSDSEVMLMSSRRDDTEDNQRPLSSTQIGQSMMSHQRSFTSDPEGSTPGHMMRNDLDNMRVDDPVKVGRPSVKPSPELLSSAAEMGLKSSVENGTHLAISGSSATPAQFHSPPQLTAPPEKVLIAPQPSVIQAYDIKPQENIQIIKVKAEPQDHGYETPKIVNVHSKIPTSNMAPAGHKFTANVPLIPVFSTYESHQFRQNSFCNKCAENMTVIDSFKAEIDLMKEIVRRKDEQIVHLQGLLEQKKREATHYVNRVVEHSIPVNNITADFIHLASRIFDATQKLRSAINEPIYTLPQQPPPR